MDAHKYKQQAYGGFDLRGQSSRVKGQILETLRLSLNSIGVILTTF